MINGGDVSVHALLPPLIIDSGVSDSDVSVHTPLLPLVVGSGGFLLYPMMVM